jgi:hypothetical protein
MPNLTGQGGKNARAASEEVVKAEPDKPVLRPFTPHQVFAMARKMVRGPDEYQDRECQRCGKRQSLLSTELHIKRSFARALSMFRKKLSLCSGS